MLPDYHVHSDHSCDAHDSIAALCAAAAKLGLSEIGISDHFDNHPEDECSGFFKPDAFWRALEAARSDPDPEITIRAGLEFGEPHRFKTEGQLILDAYPWDFVLGSLHWVEDTLIFDVRYFEQPMESAYRRYFTELLQAVQQGEFDILAHMDIVKRYGFDYYGAFDPGAWEPEIRSILRELARSDRGLEVNSGTLRRPVGETSPAGQILRWFREEGGRLVTFGSDAHDVLDLGAGWPRAVQEMRSAGFTQYAAYVRRQPELRPLPIT